MDRSKRLAVLDSSQNILMVFDYRVIVIPAQKRRRNDDLTPGNVKLWESPGRAGGLPSYLG
ncbi:MAG: hypothetical protein WB930_03820 [Syntrophobacteraceae bacterium]